MRSDHSGAKPTPTTSSGGDSATNYPGANHLATDNNAGARANSSTNNTGTGYVSSPRTGAGACANSSTNNESTHNVASPRTVADSGASARYTETYNHAGSAVADASSHVLRPDARARASALACSTVARSHAVALTSTERTCGHHLEDAWRTAGFTSTNFQPSWFPGAYNNKGWTAGTNTCTGNDLQRTKSSNADKSDHHWFRWTSNGSSNGGPEPCWSHVAPRSPLRSHRREALGISKTTHT